jgi:endoglucanase
MLKEFTSPSPFQNFQVLDQHDGQVVMTGGAPSRVLPVQGLGTVSTVWVGDFSGLDHPGRYRVVASNGLESYPFDVAPTVFDAAIRAVQRSFYFQRAFTEIDAAHAHGPWVHPSDADLAPAGVRKGWHDAGDFSIYSATMSTALFWLLETASDFAPAADDTGIPESGNGVPDLLDETRWGLEWLLSTQDLLGGFQNTTCEESYGPYGENSPERADPYRRGEVGTLATARAVGTLAYASTIFQQYDPVFAQQCLAAALKGEQYLREHPREDSDGPTCPVMRADGDANVGKQVRMYAASGLLLATGEPRYRDEFEQSYVELDYDPSHMHFNGFAAQVYLRAPAGDPERKAAILRRLAGHTEEVRLDGDSHPFRWAPRTHWGSIAAAFIRTGSYSVHACLRDPVGAAADCEQALASVHYLMGRNYLQFCYVSGLEGTSHARRWSFHHWLATLRAEPHDFPGMVAGGPNDRPEAQDISKAWARPVPVWGYWGDPAFPRGPDTPFEERFTDNDSWSTNEVDIEWQATVLYGLYFARWMARREPEHVRNRGDPGSTGGAESGRPDQDEPGARSSRAR